MVVGHSQIPVRPQVVSDEHMSLKNLLICFFAEGLWGVCTFFLSLSVG